VGGDAAVGVAGFVNKKGDALVIFQPSGRRGRFPKGIPVLQAARQLGVYLESVCGGRGLCGRCQIKIASGNFAKYGVISSPDNLTPIAEQETRYRERKPLDDDRRLGCSSRIQGDLVVEIPDDAAANRQIVRKDAEQRIIPRDLSTHLCYVEVAKPDISAPTGDADRLLATIGADWGYNKSLRLDAAIFPGLQKTLRRGDWRVTAAVFQETGSTPIVTGLWPGLKEAIYGLTIDIGSTTIAAHLCDLMTGEVIGSGGALNPQIRFGEDLMSRVSYIQLNPGSQTELTATVRQAVDQLIRDTASEAGVDTDDILEAVVVGNPIMHHLFLDIDPTELGGSPFALALSSATTRRAENTLAALQPAARIHTLPCVAGHVGADAAAVALSERPYKAKKITLLVDIGTNAEIILGNREQILAASSPTGPAFEGAEISCGQRAAPGAIERVRIDRKTFAPRYKIIGVEAWSDQADFDKMTKKTPVTGICGSGIVEAVAELYLSGLLTEDGVMQPPPAGAERHFVQAGRTWSYVLHRGPVEISVSQKDVRAIQLAKAALYAGVRLLMDYLGTDEVHHVRMAGAFGSYIDPKYAMVLGLIPDCDLENVLSVGNAASTGARMALLNRKYRREIQTQVEKLTKVETAMEPRFQEHFVEAMALPHKTAKFLRLRAQVELPANIQKKRSRRR